MWACERCGREFGRVGQGHVCVPAMSVDEYFASRPAYEREVFEAVAEHLRSLGPVTIEPVGVGILVKKGRTFVELRPMKQWVALSMILPRVVDHPRVTRVIRMSGGRAVNYVRLRGAEDVDDLVREWITESWVESR